MHFLVLPLSAIDCQFLSQLPYPLFGDSESLSNGFIGMMRITQHGFQL
jgi:hypothetical protein